MNPLHLRENDIKLLLERNGAALALEAHLPRALRVVILRSLGFGIFFILFILLALFVLGSSVNSIAIVHFFAENITRMIGLVSFFSALWLIFFALEMFALSHYFGGLKTTLSRTELYKRDDAMSFALLTLLYKNVDEQNLVTLLYNSKEAETFFMRLGLDPSSIREALKATNVSLEKSFPLKRNGKMLLISDLLTYIYKKSDVLQSFFFERGITDEIYYGALDWTERIRREQEKSLRSWSRINLSEMPGIAKDWSYGGAYTLKRYAREVSPFRYASLATRHAEDAVETVLSKSDEANALIIGERGSTRETIAGYLAFRIQRGTANADIEGKHVFILDPTLFTTSNPTKQTYEIEMTKLLIESAQAGNVVLVIDDIPTFLLSAQSIGVDVLALFDPYLKSDVLQVIATTTLEEKNTVLTRFPFVKERFEPVTIPYIDEDDLIFILSYRALQIEAHGKSNVFFTFQSLTKTAELVRNVLQNPLLPDDAFDILESAYARARSEGRVVITANIIEELVSARSGIPVGKITADEKQSLLELEDTLSNMVVGQKDALRAVANALRRSRAGIGTQSQPMGSFLFLGPTGVGKTQVARALEMALFSRDNAMSRLDMSEFSGADALERLIGGTSGNIGIMETLIAKAPYGVLLLDEFEKANPDVHNLFLQILDEGFYSNARGARVSLRNLIIIATSNAGAKEILKATETQGELSWYKDELVQKFIRDNVFRPELLNRFDDIILFEPLSKEDLYKIAEFELEKLKDRIKNARIRLNVTPELLEFIVQNGYDPTFGARPMKRIIEQTVERIISEKILRGDITAGSTLTLSRAELEAVL